MESYKMAYATRKSTLSPALLNVLFEQCSKGKIRPTSLYSNVENNVLIDRGTHGAMFRKEGPNDYTVVYFRQGIEMGQEKASNTIEARGLVIDYLISAKAAEPA
jgi:hypothetical protein